MAEPYVISIKLDLGSSIPFFSATVNNYVRYDDDVDIELYDQLVQFWAQIPAVLADTRIKTSKHGPLQLALDWSNVLAYLNRYDTRRYNECFPTPPEEYYYSEDWYEEPYNPDQCTIFGKLTVPEGTQNVPGKYPGFSARSYLIHFFYQVFVALNVASPGCFDLTRRNLQIEDERHEEKLDLDDSLWAGAFHQARRIAGWPVISQLPLAQTWNWVCSLKLGEKVMAHTGIEKAVFALLHACSEESFHYQLMWITTALEALFSIPVGAAGDELLWSRITLLLGEPPEDKERIRLLMDELRGIRSAVFHGILPIPHPLGAPDSNEDMELIIDHSIEAMAIAAAILVAALQKCAQNNWVDFKFSEDLQGITAADG